MATDPCARYPTARALADELDAWTQHEQRKRDRLRLAFAGIAMGVSLAVILLTASRFVATGASLRPDSSEEHASISVGPVDVEPETHALGEIPRSAAEPSTARKPDASSATEAILIGNSERHSYHLAGCYHLKDMAKSHQVILASPAEAAAKKYAPCKTCKPPVVPFIPTQFDSSPNSGKPD